MKNFANRIKTLERELLQRSQIETDPAALPIVRCGSYSGGRAGFLLALANRGREKLSKTIDPIHKAKLAEQIANVEAVAAGEPLAERSIA